MSALGDIAAEYLRLRRLLGHDLAEAHRLLPRFVAYLDSIGAATVTIDAALAWATEPGVDPAGTVAARRMEIARGFARHLAGVDERTEIPPLGLIPMRQHWRPPFLFTPDDITTLLGCARAMRWRLPAATHATLLGLLAATGMRVGEALRLEPSDIDRVDDVIVIRQSKFGKSRLVPVLPDTLAALDDYTAIRDRLRPDRVNDTDLRVLARHRADLPGRPAGVPQAVRHRPHRCRRTPAAADPRPSPHLRRHRAHRLVSRRGEHRSSAPGVVDLPRSPRPAFHLLVSVRRPRTARPRRRQARSLRRGGQPMSLIAPTLQSFFTDRLAKQRRASARTIAAYRDSLRLLVVFVHHRTGKPPCSIDWDDLGSLNPAATASSTDASRDPPSARGRTATTRQPRRQRDAMWASPRIVEGC